MGAKSLHLAYTLTNTVQRGGGGGAQTSPTTRNNCFSLDVRWNIQLNLSIKYWWFSVPVTPWWETAYSVSLPGVSDDWSSFQGPRRAGGAGLGVLEQGGQLTVHTFDFLYKHAQNGPSLLVADLSLLVNDTAFICFLIIAYVIYAYVTLNGFFVVHSIYLQ